MSLFYFYSYLEISQKTATVILIYLEVPRWAGLKERTALYCTIVLAVKNIFK